ncbi:MAG TPA: metallophosphoesterase [Thermoanaerobaculia bacterium]|nr:metallophosphoesterase [Thermoanaerobaculia bacterium]
MLLLVFALAGDARLFLFVANRIVFGSHREEKSRFHWLLYAVPPLLLILTLLMWKPWLLFAAAVGVYWILDRAHMLLLGKPAIAGVHTLPSEIVKLRKRHLPYPAHNDVYDIEITRHEVFIDDLPRAFDGYRIAFLTDTHVASFMRRALYREVVAQTLRFQPDLILLGGDFVTWERHIPLMAEVLLTDLTAPDGVYAVLGNHDYWANADGVVAAMTARGVRFLINRSVVLTRGEDRILLGGIDEMYRGAPDVDTAFGRADRDMPRIAVSHHPDIVDLLRDERIDLLVCGHTHGGQIRAPFFGSIVVPSRHEARYASGFHRLDRVLLYVSRGIGAIPPVRILCKPEVATFILRRTGDADETVRSLE